MCYLDDKSCIFTGVSKRTYSFCFSKLPPQDSGRKYYEQNNQVLVEFLFYALS